MSPGDKFVMTTVCLLLATIGVLFLEGAGCFDGQREAARQFQRMSGGLGLGATVRPRWCFVNFDPRVEGCTCMEQPIPGGYCYCPEHTGTVSFFVPHGADGFDTEEKGMTGR